MRGCVANLSGSGHEQAERSFKHDNGTCSCIKSWESLYMVLKIYCLNVDMDVTLIGFKTHIHVIGNFNIL
jgi:hypothetical protein